jgi:hypothetical protein
MSPPWMMQTLLLDRQIERFRAALEMIAHRWEGSDAMAPEQAIATLREVANIARTALEPGGQITPSSYRGAQSRPPGP